MTCDPRSPCPPGRPGLGLVPPPPGAARLRRRSGDFAAFVADLVRRTEQQIGPDGRPLGSSWDVEGDPRAMRLVRLWAYVAETVAAYAELTANESYLATAADWTDLRRLAALVGHRPRPGVAASGWVRVDTDKGASPLVPAGTRVRAPAAPGVRDAQTFEVAEDTRLRADWAGLTATPVPVASAPTGRDLRFLSDPGFAPGDRVLLVEETPSPAAPVLGGGWWSYWSWMLWYAYSTQPSANQPLAVTVVDARVRELGTAVVTFDRDLGPLLPDVGTPYAAYRVVASAGSARRISHALRVGATSATPVPIANYTPPAAMSSGPSGSFVVLDAALDDVSKGQLVAVVDWSRGKCDVVRITRHSFLEWEVAPGSTVRVSKLEFDGAVAALGSGGPVTAYVVDRRVAARHYEFPTSVTGTPARLRLYPAPADFAAPPRIAVRSVVAGEPVWQVFACQASSDQETATGGAPRGLTVDLLDGTPAGDVDRQPATGNLVRVRHGTSATDVLGSGDATRAGQAMAVPKSPVAADVGPDGTPRSTLLVRVAGMAWQERPSLYAAGHDEAYTTTLDADGGVTVHFGDGRQGSRLPTGRNTVTASYRVGGGVAGEVPSGAIDALVGSIRGVRGVGGVGATSGGADADDESRLRALAPARARAFGRVVSVGDLADIARAFPGVSHAAAWRGAPPPRCGCGRPGLHVAFLRAARTGPRPPVADEIGALSDHLNTRRDTTVPLCVAAGTVSSVHVTIDVVRDPRLAAGATADGVRATLLDPSGPLAPLGRSLGTPLDRSDVAGAVHTVRGVVGVRTLALAGGTLPAAAGAVVGRLAAMRHELLVIGDEPDVTEVVA